MMKRIEFTLNLDDPTNAAALYVAIYTRLAVLKTASLSRKNPMMNLLSSTLALSM